MSRSVVFLGCPGRLGNQLLADLHLKALGRELSIPVVNIGIRTFGFDSRYMRYNLLGKIYLFVGYSLGGAAAGYIRFMAGRLVFFCKALSPATTWVFYGKGLRFERRIAAKLGHDIIGDPVGDSLMLLRDLIATKNNSIIVMGWGLRYWSSPTFRYMPPVSEYLGSVVVLHIRRGDFLWYERHALWIKFSEIKLIIFELVERGCERIQICSDDQILKAMVAEAFDLVDSVCVCDQDNFEALKEIIAESDVVISNFSTYSLALGCCFKKGLVGIRSGDIDLLKIASAEGLLGLDGAKHNWV